VLLVLRGSGWFGSRAVADVALGRGTTEPARADPGTTRTRCACRISTSAAQVLRVEIDPRPERDAQPRPASGTASRDPEAGCRRGGYRACRKRTRLRRDHPERAPLNVRPGSTMAKRQQIMHERHNLHDAVRPLIRKWEQKLGVTVSGYFLRRRKTKWGLVPVPDPGLRQRPRVGRVPTRPPGFRTPIVSFARSGELGG
jgi:hypothetical protein